MQRIPEVETREQIVERLTTQIEESGKIEAAGYLADAVRHLARLTEADDSVEGIEDYEEVEELFWTAIEDAGNILYEGLVLLMNGEIGCLPDNAEMYPDVESAIEGAELLFDFEDDDTADRILGELREDGVYYFSDEEHRQYGAAEVRIEPLGLNDAEDWMKEAYYTN